MAQAILRDGQGDRWRGASALLRSGPLAGLWLFAWVFLAQLGHLIEHIAKAITGAGCLGLRSIARLRTFSSTGRSRFSRFWSCSFTRATRGSIRS